MDVMSLPCSWFLTLQLDVVMARGKSFPNLLFLSRYLASDSNSCGRSSTGSGAFSFSLLSGLLNSFFLTGNDPVGLPQSQLDHGLLQELELSLAFLLSSYVGLCHIFQLSPLCHESLDSLGHQLCPDMAFLVLILSSVIQSFDCWGSAELEIVNTIKLDWMSMLLDCRDLNAQSRIHGFWIPVESECRIGPFFTEARTRHAVWFVLVLLTSNWVESCFQGHICNSCPESRSGYISWNRRVLSHKILEDGCPCPSTNHQDGHAAVHCMNFHCSWLWLGILAKLDTSWGWIREEHRINSDSRSAHRFNSQ